MDGMTIVWIVVAVAVLVIVVGLIAGASSRTSKRRAEKQREEAYEHRHQAMTSAAHAEKQQAAADEVEARARKAQAIADEKAAEARRLAAGATERRQAAADARTEADEHHAQAQNLWPDDGTPDDGRVDGQHESSDGQPVTGMREGEGRPMAGATDEQPVDEHWADGQHPDDPRHSKHTRH